jgi:DNA-binding response OmpR family regulator
VIRVLHVDDEAPIRLLSRVNLEMEGGMEVIEAANGRTGVQLAKREQPDLILLGVMMPVLDGWQAAEELRKDQETREIPIVFLTARSALKDRARGFDLGAVDYITKPFNPVELASRVRELLERLERGERDELRREKVSELHAPRDAEVDDIVGRAS